MLGREPKDFDVVTSAHPEEIKDVFRNARLIGRRFRLAHVHFGRDIIEVATFRATPEADGEGSPAQNVYGTEVEDAYRRDFTVNALYYDIDAETVIDYVGGVEDLKRGQMRMIGDPVERYREDPVRMLRAVRFAGKLGFSIEPASATPLPELAHLLRTVSPARLFEEMLKLFQSGYAVETYELLRHFGLFGHLFPLTEDSLRQEKDGFPLTLLPLALTSTDKRVQEGKPITPAFLFAALLWEPVRLAAQARMERGEREAQALQIAAEAVLREQLSLIALPKRFSFPMREIWEMQPKFTRRTGKQAYRLLTHKRFRAAYDFLALRAEVGEAAQELADWWTEFQTADDQRREEMLRSVEAPAPERKRRRRRRPVRRAAAGS